MIYWERNRKDEIVAFLITELCGRLGIEEEEYVHERGFSDEALR